MLAKTDILKIQTKTLFVCACLLCSCMKEIAPADTSDVMGEHTASFNLIEFTLGSEFAAQETKTLAVTSLNSFYVTATKGSTGSEYVSDGNGWANVTFTGTMGGSFSGGKYWPRTNPSYHFYASNNLLTTTSEGCTVTATNTKDVVCAYLASPTFKETNALTFEHIFARLGACNLTAQEGRTITNLSVSITPYSGGTYNLRTGSWSSLSQGSATTIATTIGSDTDNDLWLVPGTYTVTATFTSSASLYSETLTKTATVTLVAGKTNNLFGSFTDDNAEDIVFDVEIDDWSHQESDIPDEDILKNSLRFEIISSGNITWNQTGRMGEHLLKPIFYSKDFGLTWYQIDTGESIPVEAGELLFIRGDNSPYATFDRYCYFGTNDGATFSIVGDIRSLCGGTDSVESHYCQFRRLFSNCTGLISAEYLILPATTLDTYCYREMFLGCTALTSTPALPATTLAPYCYAGMFSGCTSITTAPELPATTLADADGCYSNMFSGCTGLTTASELPATVVAYNCYLSMYYGCTALTSAPKSLPCTDLSNSGDGKKCYESMFEGCTSLIYAPHIAATIGADNAFKRMFYGCSSLIQLRCDLSDASSPCAEMTDNWLYGVADGGIFIKSPTATWDLSGPTGIPETWCSNPLEFDIITGGQIIWKCSNADAAKNISYSRNNGKTWTGITSNTAGKSISVNSGDVILFKGTNTNYATLTGYNSFNTSSGTTFNVKGDISSLSLGNSRKTLGTSYKYANLFKDCEGLISAGGLLLPANTLAGHCYESMFQGCTSLTSAPALPATTLAEYCYQDMFYGCTELTTPPSLPATTLAPYCYAGMFYSCTSLTTAPELPSVTMADGCYISMLAYCKCLTSAPTLPATTLAYICYESMFEGCTGLTSPTSLPATTLAEACYANMFKDCTGLTSTPVLSAITLADACYEFMFYGCIGLTSAPALPATALASGCYHGFFEGCTGLTTAPVLPATTLAPNCYDSMFMGCTGLTMSPSLPATTLASGCYANMFNGCTALTTAAPINATTLTDGCYAAMFYDCTSLTNAPALPATTLASSCYHSMFYGCTSLTSAPRLRALTLVSGCYGYMFHGCSSLNYVEALFTTTPGNDYTANWLSGVKSTGVFYKNSSASWSVSGSSGIPSGWTTVTVTP